MHNKIKQFIQSILFKVFPFLERKYYISLNDTKSNLEDDLLPKDDILEDDEEDLEEEDLEDEDLEDQTDLEEASNLISEHIPVVISDFHRASEEIPDLHKKIVGTFITSVTYNEKYIYAKLHHINGHFAGYLRFNPTEGGVFSSYQSQSLDLEAEDEEDEEDDEDVDLLYKITFYGGSVLEYYDSVESPAIDYFINLPKRIK